MSECSDERFMRRALSLAKEAAEQNEVPVGAVVVMNDEIIGEAANGTITQCDPSGHAEILALRAASKHMANYRLPEASIFITIEPCAMCLGAIVQSRISRVVFGAHEPKAGVLESNRGLLDDDCLNHHFDVTGGVLKEECADLISSFFRERRTTGLNSSNSFGFSDSANCC